MPGAAEVRRRGEGVAIVLSGEAVGAWRAGGRQWKAWNSWLVTATLKFGRGKRGYIHVLSCYALTFAASSREEDFLMFYRMPSHLFHRGVGGL